VSLRSRQSNIHRSQVGLHGSEPGLPWTTNPLSPVVRWARNAGLGGYSLTFTYRIRIVVVNFALRLLSWIRYDLFTKTVVSYKRRETGVNLPALMFTLRIDNMVGVAKVVVFAENVVNFAIKII